MKKRAAENPISRSGKILLGALAGAAVIGGGVAFAVHNAHAAHTTTWTRVGDLTFRAGKTYRASMRRGPNMSPEEQAALQEIMPHLAEIDALIVENSATEWGPSERFPADWPEDDRGPDRSRIEFTMKDNVAPFVLPPVLEARAYVKG